MTSTGKAVATVIEGSTAILADGSLAIPHQDIILATPRNGKEGLFPTVLLSSATLMPFMLFASMYVGVGVAGIMGSFAGYVAASVTALSPIVVAGIAKVKLSDPHPIAEIDFPSLTHLLGNVDFQDERIIKMRELMIDRKATGEVAIGHFSVDNLTYREGFVQLDESYSLLNCNKRSCNHCDASGDIPSAEYVALTIGLEGDLAKSLDRDCGYYYVEQTFIKDSEGSRVKQEVVETPISVWDSNMNALESLVTSPKRKANN